ncbi:MAG: hypothetical protein IKS33_08715 [Bacteroidales bacterium]|nr:hypothetical protein [Bacteroidales bacterium]
MEVDIDRGAQRCLEIIRKNFKITTCVERHLPDDMYTRAAISLMDALESGVFEDFENLLDNDVQTILYSKKEIRGKSATSEYLKNWRENYIFPHSSIDSLEVRWFHFCSHTCLISSHTRDNKILFLFNFNNAKIFQILLMPIGIDLSFEEFIYSNTLLYALKISSHPWSLSNILYFLYKFDFMVLNIVDVDKEKDICEEEDLNQTSIMWRSYDSVQGNSEVVSGAFNVPINIPSKDSLCNEILNEKDVYIAKARQIFSVKYDLINLFCAKTNVKSVSENQIEDVFLKKEVQKILSELTDIEFCDSSTIKITTSTSYYMEEDAPNLMIGGKDNDLFHIWADKEHEIVCVSEIDDDKDIWISKLDIDKHIRVNPTEMGAWQLFLLVNLSIILPSYCWHTSCGRKEYVFNETDLENVINKNNSYHNRELKHLMHLLKNNLPKVEIVENKLSGCTIQIGCCYWGDWSGLNKEETKITIVDRQCVSYETKTTNLYHSYNNGIYF